MSNNAKFKQFLSFLSYVAVMLIGLSLAIGYIFKGGAINEALRLIATIISYVIVSASSLFYARSKRNIWYIVAWIVAVVLIVIFMIL